MSEDPLRIPEYLDHIVQAIERIKRYTADLDEAAFLADDLVQDAVIRNIEVIGEAARNVDRHHPKFAALHSDVPWQDIYLMRNRVAHGYFSIDLGIVWKTVKRDIPELEQQVAPLRFGLADGSVAGNGSGVVK